jgi:hypothetical protein
MQRHNLLAQYLREVFRHPRMPKYPPELSVDVSYQLTSLPPSLPPSPPSAPFFILTSPTFLNHLLATRQFTIDVDDSGSRSISASINPTGARLETLHRQLRAANNQQGMIDRRKMLLILLEKFATINTQVQPEVCRWSCGQADAGLYIGPLPNRKVNPTVARWW